MGEFNEALFRHVAVGPEKNPNQPHRNPLPRNPYGTRCWTEPQRELRERAKEKLYEVMMHRAADFMKHASQKNEVEEKDRIAMINLTVFFTTKAADAEANGERDNHQKVGENILTIDAGQQIVAMATDSEYTKAAIKQFNDKELRNCYGLVCP